MQITPPQPTSKDQEFLPGVTLQINVSAGDLRYLKYTIPRLVKQHRESCVSVLIVLDACRPQRTPIVDPDVRFPKERFFQQVNETKETLFSICRDIGVERCVILEESRDQEYFRYLAKKYVGNGCLIGKGMTHAGGGAAFMAYFAALDIPTTEYVLHFDGDMILYQKEGYSWVNDALEHMEKDNRIISAIPRNAPPLSGEMRDVQPQLKMGRPLENFGNNWGNDWFSTRIFLMNRKKLSSYLPLLTIFPIECGKFLSEMWIRRLLRRCFPRDPEILLFKRLSPINKRTLILKSLHAWTLHPVDKGPWFTETLPRILDLVDQGKTPIDQQGVEDIDSDIWKEFLSQKTAC